MACSECSRSLHDECSNYNFDDEACCCSSLYPQALLSEEPVTKSRKIESPMGVRAVSVSAGRKEAAKLYPVKLEDACEWRGLANAGGGKNPIVGCATGLQQARHHGPVKNTTENDRNNIHLICHTCHNRWHAANNPVYDEEVYRTMPHKPRVATAKELIDARAKLRTSERSSGISVGPVGPVGESSGELPDNRKSYDGGNSASESSQIPS